MFKHWSSELRGYSEQELVQGLERFKQSGSTYMSLNVFRSHCQKKAEHFGLDGFDDAYRAVIFREWESVHPAFQHVCQQHRFELRRKSESEARKAFKPLYNEVVKRVSCGEVFERIKSIEQDQSNPSEVKVFGRDQGNKVLKALFKQMGVNKL